jgi:hypothetical protein
MPEETPRSTNRKTRGAATIIFVRKSAILRPKFYHRILRPLGDDLHTVCFFDRRMALAKKRKATLLVAKLDQLSRSRLTLHVLSAAAEHERHMISERTRQALAAAKACGVKLGNRKQAKANNHKADRYAKTLRPILIELRHLPVEKIADELSKRKIATPRGGPPLVWQDGGTTAADNPLR